MSRLGKVSCVKCGREMNIGNFIAKHWKNCRIVVQLNETPVPVGTDPFRWIVCPSEAARKKVVGSIIDGRAKIRWSTAQTKNPTEVGLDVPRG